MSELINREQLVRDVNEVLTRYNLAMMMLRRFDLEAISEVYPAEVCALIEVIAAIRDALVIGEEVTIQAEFTVDQGLLLDAPGRVIAGLHDSIKIRLIEKLGRFIKVKTVESEEDQTLRMVSTLRIIGESTQIKRGEANER